MKRRAKKKNLLKKMEGQSRKLEQMSRAIGTLIDENNVLRKTCKDLEKIFDFMGTLPIYKEIWRPGESDGTVIQSQRIRIQPLNYGAAEVLKPEEMLYRTIEDKKRDLAIRLAEAMIEQHVAQFIHKPANPHGGPLERNETLGVRLYVVPWQQVQMYKSGVLDMRVLAEENDENYAVKLAVMSEEKRRRLLEKWKYEDWEAGK